MTDRNEKAKRVLDNSTKVIAGIGVRNYYIKLGFKSIENTMGNFLIANINKNNHIYIYIISICIIIISICIIFIM